MQRKGGGKGQFFMVIVDSAELCLERGSDNAAYRLVKGWQMKKHMTY